jgi:hypothetical protein
LAISYKFFTYTLLASLATTVLVIAPAQPQDSNSSPTPQVQGGVKVIELDLELLKEVGIDIKNVIKAAGSLYDEVNIRPVQIITQPEVVGRGTVVYLPVGTIPIGPPAPPRKKRLDRAIAQIDPVIAALKQDADDVRAGRAEIGVSDSVREELSPLFKEWGQIVDAIEEQRVELHKLTERPPYDNAAISARANAIAAESEKLDQTRRKIYKVLQKEGRKHR